MRKGQQSVLEKANEYMMRHYGNELTEVERKLLMNEKWKVSFYKDLLIYIKMLRVYERILTYEEMLHYVDLIYEYISEKQWSFFFYRVSVEEEKTTIWLLLEHRDLFYENFKNITDLYNYAHSNKEICVRNVIEKALTLEEPFRYIMAYAYLMNKSDNLQLIDAYSTALSLNNECEFLLQKASHCVKNNLDVTTAKKYNFNHGHCLYDMYKNKREYFYKYYPIEDPGRLNASGYTEPHIIAKEDNVKVDIIKDLVLNCDIETKAYREKYKYSPTGFSVTINYYEKIHTYNKKIYCPSAYITESIEVLFLFTTEYPISIYIKKYGKWIPATCKEFAKYCSGHSDSGIMKLMECIEDVFLTNGNMFIKNVMKYIKSGRFIPPLTLNDIYNYTDFNYAFGYKYPCPKNWNKNDINALYCAYKLRKYIEPTHQNLIFEVVNEELLNNAFIENISFRRRNNTLNALVKIVATYLSEKTKANYRDVKDYVTMCYLSGEKIKLGLKSRRKLIEQHNRIARTHYSKIKSLSRNPVLVAKDSKFNKLRELLPKDEFEWIKRTGRLDAESVMQHNCVWSYADLIKRDRCAIYHFVYQPENDAYTIEFRTDKKGGYKIAQMQKSCNEGHSIEAFNYVERFISEPHTT